MKIINGSYSKDRVAFKAVIIGRSSKIIWQKNTRSFRFKASVILRKRGGKSSKELLIAHSVHAVLNNDDLLIEILLRLPVISLLQLKPVCKRWFSLITNPTFTLRRSQIPTLDPPCGLLTTHYVGSSGYKHCLLSFDTRIPYKISAFKKNPFTFGSGQLLDAKILDSCNGLLLLCCSNTHATARMYYVYNPCINLMKALPQCSTKLVRRGDSGARIAFDPTKSPHYKVIRAVDVCEDAGIRFNIQIETYSSETGMWTVFCGGYLQPSFVGFGEDGIYWNDALYWHNNLHDQDPLLIKLDISVEGQELTTIEYPRTLDGDLYQRDVKLFETCGCLLILCRMDGNPLLMDVYEMKKGYSEWLVKYHVDLNEDVSCPRRSWTDPIVYSIVLGEREEDSFIVIEEKSEKILQYKLVLKTSHHLYDLKSAYQTSHVPSRLKSAYHIRSFPFIASFAGVGL